MLRIFPAVEVAVAILALMSQYWSPSALNLEPRYLNTQTFSISLPSHLMCASFACISLRILLRVSLSAVVPLQTCLV